MQRRPFATLALAVLVLGLALSWRAGAARVALAAGAGSGSALVALGAALIVGRIVLSLLPPGHLGSHRLGALATTAAASLVLGETALALEARLSGLPVRGGGAVRLLLFVLPWLALGAARVATLPGAMVPRHPLPAASESTASRALALALVLAALAPLLLVWTPTDLGDLGDLAGGRLSAAAPPAERLTGAAEWAALLALAAHGLAGLRRATGERRLALLLLAASPLGLVLAASPERAGPTLALGACAVLGVGWVRRADARELWIAALALGGLGLAGETSTATAGLIALVLASAAPARRRAGAAALAGAALVLLGARSSHPYVAGAGLEELLPLPPLAPWGALWIAFSVAVVARARRAAARGAEPDPERPVTPEDAASERWLVLLVLFAFALALGFPYGLRERLLPAALLFVALELVRPTPIAARPAASP